MKKIIFTLVLTCIAFFGISWQYGPNIQDFIIHGSLFSALNKETQEKIIFLSKEMKEGKDPSFESVSCIFPDYMKYPKAIVGVKEHPDRFLSSWDGAIVFPPMYISFEVNDTPFGRAEEKNVSRSLLDNYLPVVVTNYKYDGLIYEQTIFGYSEGFSTKNQLIAFVKMKVKNSSVQKKDTKLSIWFRGTGVHLGGHYWATSGPQVIHCPRMLSLEGNKILDENGDVIFYSESQGRTFEKDKLFYELSLGPNEEKELHFRIPYHSIIKNEIGLLSEPSFDSTLEKVRVYWKEVVERGMQVDVPEKIVKNAYKTWHINNFLLVQENKAPRSYKTSDAPFFYDLVYGYAASMYLNTITTGGYYEEAKKCAGMLIKLQRPDGALSGDAEVIPHQNGAILYAVSQVYRKERDDEWFKTIAPNIIKACNWLISERSKSRQMVDGKKPVTYGMLPVYRFCVDEVAGSTKSQEYVGNSWCWAGLNQAAIALGELGGEFKKEGIRLKKEADQYRADIFASMEKAVIKQDDVPFLPMVMTDKKPFKNLQESRPAQYYNILSPRMLESEIFDADDERIHWIPDYLERRGGIILGMVRMGGGLWSIDPHFAGGYGITNLRLNKIDKFLMTFYGLVSYGMARELYSTQEMSNILVGNSNEWSSLRQPHLHSTSELIRLTNLMLIKEERDEIWLAFGVPRKWLEDGNAIEVKKAQTCFGPFNFRIESHVSKGFIKANISSSLRKSPSAIKLKLRHPEGTKISRVEVNGAIWKDFKGEIINLTGSNKKYSIIAYYN
jgi:hypothetical protein